MDNEFQKNIKKEKIPGCDTLTRPEEIKSLSKFLKKVKKEQEKFIESNPKELLLVPGKDTGKFPLIKKLEDNVEQLEINNKISKLSDHVENLNINESLTNIKLEKYIDKLETNGNELQLKNYIDKLNKSNNDDVNLSSYIEELDVNKNIEDLPNYVENLSVDKSTNNLSEYVENLSVDKNINNLSDHVENLNVNKTTENLSNYVGKLNVNKNIDNLSDHIENLNVNKNTNNLSDYVENLSVDKNIDNLSDHVENLDIDKNTDNLSDHVENLNVNKNTNNLSDYVENLSVDKNIDNLSDHVENLDVNKTTENLSDYVENLSVDKNIDNLSDHVENLDVNKTTENLSNYVGKLNVNKNIDNLSDHIENLDVNKTTENLSDYIENLDINKNIDNLSSYIENLNVDKDNTDNLPDHIENLDIDKNTDNLSSYIENLNIDKNTEDLSNYIEDLSVDKNINNLESTKLNIPEEKGDDVRINDDYSYFDTTNINNTLYDTIIGNLPDENSINDSLLSQKISSKKILLSENSSDTKKINKYKTNEELNTISDIKDYNKDDIKNIPSFEKSNENVDYVNYINSLSNDELYNQLLNILEFSGNWGQKMSTYVSTYLSAEAISKRKKKEFENKLYDEGTLISIEYKLPEFNLGMINPSSYLRYIAEETVSSIKDDRFNKGSIRRILLEETLAFLVWMRRELEVSTKVNRDRLPGDDSGLLGDILNNGVNAVNNLASRAIDAFMPGIDINNPINRPKKDGIYGDPKKLKEIEGWQQANNRIPVSSGLNAEKDKYEFGKALKNFFVGGNSTTINYPFKDVYLNGEGISTTIEDLCIDKSVSDINTVQDLFDSFRESPFITTPEKFTTTGNNGSNSMTLDSNSFWEIVLEPYVGPENGWISYLPALHEINTRNILTHGVRTTYNRWIPFISFDLQKSRLSSRSLSLYNGEIQYPISVETLNELRLVIVDDQYKSWRTYFENCMEVSVYNSEPHTKDYYNLQLSTSPNNSNGSDEDNVELTAVDKSNILISMYKNLAFRCRIYVMTPQKSTIRKFDLLLVMKDFSEEYSGDIDSGGGSDLTISFSIVGENPIGSLPIVSKEVIDNTTVNKEPTSNSVSTILDSYISKGISLIM